MTVRSPVLARAILYAVNRWQYVRSSEGGEQRAGLTQSRSTTASLFEAKSWPSKPAAVQNTAPVWPISELLAERLRVGEEELLAVDLEACNRGLPLRARDPVDERLSEVVLHIRVLGRVHQDDPILVQQALIALDYDGQVAPVLEGEPRASIGEQVGVAGRSHVQGCSHSLADLAIPRASHLTQVDVGHLPKSHFSQVSAREVTPRDERSFLLPDPAQS